MEDKPNQNPSTKDTDLDSEPSISKQLDSFASSPAKYTVFAVFTLYLTGFIVWHSYLSAFGVSSIDLPQQLYLGAGICYIVLLSVFVVPTLLCLILLSGKTLLPHNFPKLTVFSFLNATAAVWYIFARGLTVRHSTANDSSMVLFKISLGVSLATRFIEWKFSRISLKVANRLSFIPKRFNKVAKIQDHDLPGSVLYTASTMLLLVGIFVQLNATPIINSMFFIMGKFGFIAVSISFVFFKSLEEARRKKGFHPMSIVIMAGFFLFLAQFFGTGLFGTLPKKLGGGEPDMAFIKFSVQHAETSTMFNIPTSDRFGPSNLFSGPVAIMSRTEKEIIFVNCPDTEPDYFTTNITTNVSPRMATNNSVIASSVARSVQTLQTNVVPHRPPQMSMNYVSKKARQIKTEFVDGIIFVP